MELQCFGPTIIMQKNCNIGKNILPVKEFPSALVYLNQFSGNMSRD
jgi:hypothetical protein